MLSTGSSGDSVRFVQSYLNAVAGRAFLTVDGIYGQNVTRAVSSFQAANSLKVDGNEYVLILVSDSQATLEPAVAVNVYTGELKSYYPDGTIHDYQGFSSDDDNTPKG